MLCNIKREIGSGRSFVIDGVKLKELKRHCDERGFFLEVLRDDDALMPEHFGQTSYTITYAGVIKAFHWHKRQDDIWFVGAGTAQIVLHDIRPDSATHGSTQVIYAGEQNPILVFIPRGVAHGYKVLGNQPVALFYHTNQSYNPADPDEERIPYDDPGIGFDWKS